MVIRMKEVNKISTPRAPELTAPAQQRFGKFSIVQYQTLPKCTNPIRRCLVVLTAETGLPDSKVVSTSPFT